MKKSFIIDAVIRNTKGKGASRRLRRVDMIPGIVYGTNQEPKMISIDHNLLSQLLKNESFYTQILELSIEGEKELVILRDLQRHPFKPRVLHIDLQRISSSEKIIMRIPFHFVGGELSPGVKVSGGLISHLMSDVEVRCLPKDLPEFIEIDLSKLELNKTIHLSDLKLASGIEIIALLHNEDKPIATSYIPRAAEEATTESAVAASEVPVVGEEAAKEEPEEDKGKPKGKEK